MDGAEMIAVLHVIGQANQKAAIRIGELKPDKPIER
jgi:hypothetical protein